MTYESSHSWPYRSPLLSGWRICQWPLQADCEMMRLECMAFYLWPDEAWPIIDLKLCRVVWHQTSSYFDWNPFDHDQNFTPFHPWDIPRNLTIRTYGPAGHTLMEHELDVIVLVKRFASDDNLAQDTCILIPNMFHIAYCYQNTNKLKHLNGPAQEPMLALPYKYLDYLPDCPSVPRALNPPKPAKRKDYVYLARVLLNRFPTQVMSRAVSYLLEVADKTTPGSLGDLSGWFLGPCRIDDVQIQNSAILSRVAPAMKFRANLRR